MEDGYGYFSQKPVSELSSVITQAQMCFLAFEHSAPCPGTSSAGLRVCVAASQPGPANAIQQNGRKEQAGGQGTKQKNPTTLESCVIKFLISVRICLILSLISQR